ncbi:stalk domain-containing protein [Paenibacillus odorifer]|uniref:stalk domain-containing protein n=1 Tax=Paenibacillus odorifer TaxID=189426 RepID=UPI0009D6F594|nr:stalk domain-containing protein [Paenibacillus odorifer]
MMMLASRLQNNNNPRKSPGIHTKSKRFIGYFLLCFSLLALLTALITAFIDPLQFYHRPSWYTPLLSEEERYQNPGLAKNYDYDNIIIGTSMTENFLPSQVDASLGGTTLKLSMEGSTVDEHYKIAKLALETGKVKQVLWGLDYFSLKLATAVDEEDFPDYLYDGKLWTDYKYWFNSSVYKQFISSIKNNLSGEAKQNLEYLYNWDNKVVFGKQYVAESYLMACDKELDYGTNEESIEQVKGYFNTYIRPLLEEYPDVQFYFYYPPYSVMRQVAWSASNPVRFNNQLFMRQWIFEQFEQFPNVKLYDFQAEADWTFNLDLYKDLSHHNGEVNTWIAEAIGQDNSKYRVTSSNIKALNSSLESQAESAVMDNNGKVYRSSVQVNGLPLALNIRLVQGNKELWLPAKDIGTALGASITWDAATKTVSLTSAENTVTMTVGSVKALVNGKALTIDAAPLLAGGKVLVPLAFVAEQLGWNVSSEKEGEWLRYNLSTSDNAGTLKNQP